MHGHRSAHPALTTFRFTTHRSALRSLSAGGKPQRKHHPLFSLQRPHSDVLRNILDDSQACFTRQIIRFSAKLQRPLLAEITS